MIPQATIELEEFLNRFFGAGNDLTKEQIDSGATVICKCARQWLEDFRLKRRRTVLPRKRGQELDWYAIALSESDFRDLREQLMAFVGPSFSTFRGERTVMDKNNTTEAALIDFIGPNPMVFRFKSARDSQRQQQLVEALNLMYQVCTDIETRPPELQKATGRVLRDFHIALSADNRYDAESALQYLRKHHRLDTLNLQFLEIQLRSELGLWEELLTLPNINEILRSRRPRSVSCALIKAVYQHYLSCYEENSDVSTACQIFREEIRPQFDTLYYARMGLTEPDVLKSFMLIAVTETPQRPELRDEILSITDIPPLDLSYLRTLGKLIPDTVLSVTKQKDLVQIDVVTKAREALEEGQYDNAVELASKAMTSLDQAKVLLECAYELQTISVEKLTTEAVEALTSDDRELLFQSRKYQDFWEKIARPLGETITEVPVSIVVPSDWLDWFGMLSEPSISRERILQLAAMGVDEWSIESFVSTPDVAEKCIKALENSTQYTLGRERFHEALPHFLRFLERDTGFPRSSFKRIYEMLRMELVYSCETGTASDFTIFGDLCEAALVLGVNSTEYQVILDEATHLWTSFASLSNLRPIFDILDRLMYFACPQDKVAERLAFATLIFTKVLPWIQSGRIERETWRFLRQLSMELQLAPLLDGVETDEQELLTDIVEQDPLADLTGTLAIHTLMEAAGVRVRDILKHRSPRCKVEVNHDRVGTPRLREMARNADIFIMVTHSAKHAATIFIENCRKNQPILKPIGKGTSSILYELVKYMESTSRLSI